MDNNLQQRLIGAVVLVTLGVVFIPMILDGSGYRDRQQQRIEMPPQPDYPPLGEVRLKPVEPTHVLEQKQEQRSVPEQKSMTASQSSAEPSEALQAPLKAFALQVATLTREDSALGLRDELREDGYTAYVDTEERNGKTLYRVRIGPELDRSRLEAMEQKIRKEHKLDGFLVNHP